MVSPLPACEVRCIPICAPVRNSQTVAAYYCLDTDTKNTALGQTSKVEYGCPSGRRIASDHLRSKSPHQNGTAIDSFLLKRSQNEEEEQQELEQEDRPNFWQHAKHAKLYSDQLQACNAPHQNGAAIVSS